MAFILQFIKVKKPEMKNNQYIISCLDVFPFQVEVYKIKDLYPIYKYLIGQRSTLIIFLYFLIKKLLII